MRESVAVLDSRDTVAVLGAFIDAVEWDDAVDRIVDWGAARQSRVVCVCNVHSVVTAARDPDFLAVLNGANLATPDGMPVAWMLRLLGRPRQPRIDGPDLMWRYLARAERRGQVVSFYGSTEETLGRLREAMRRDFPALRVGVMISPPFEPSSPAEDQHDRDRIEACGTAVLFVGLGCPKQERWMASQRGRLNAVMVGVGAAFDYHAGTIRRAPPWMQRSGLEWLYRLASEPKRLWKRYLVTNSLYVWLAARQLLTRRSPG